MIREVRLIAITTLTLIIYALSIFFDKGAFLFPFPLNQLVIFIVAGQFAIWNYKKFRIASILIVLIGFFAALGNEIYWSIFLDNEQMLIFSESIYTDIFQLIASILIIILAIYFSWKQKNQTSTLFLLLFSGLFVAGTIHNSALYASTFFLLSYVIMSISSILKPKLKPLNMFWVLLLTLEASKLISIGINN